MTSTSSLPSGPPAPGSMTPDVGQQGDGSPNSAVDGSVSLSGAKVPDENLTQEQRRKRQEKLGFLKELNSQLFPEDGPGMGMGPGGPMTSAAGPIGPGGPGQTGPMGPMS